MSKLVIFNWKENPQTLKEALSLAKGVHKLVWEHVHSNVVVTPPAVFLSDVAEYLKEEESAVKMGAQDVSLFEQGAHTGEISSRMLKDLGVSYCIVGHSERRAMGESDEVISKKIQELLEVGIAPVLCVGEEKRMSKESAWQFVSSQLMVNLSFIPHTNYHILHTYVIVAYEPVWAIGGDKEVDLNHADSMISQIKSFLATSYKIQATVLYGGSVHAKNIENIFAKNIDGVLVGSASLRMEDVEKIIASAH